MAPYLALCREDAEQREYPLREVFNALRYVVRIGRQWRYLLNDLPPWDVVYQQAQRWIRTRCVDWAASWTSRFRESGHRGSLSKKSARCVCGTAGEGRSY